MVVLIFELFLTFIYHSGGLHTYIQCTYIIDHDHGVHTSIHCILLMIFTIPVACKYIHTLYTVDDSYRPGGIRAVVNGHRWVENTLEEEVFGAKMPNFDILLSQGYHIFV